MSYTVKVMEDGVSGDLRELKSTIAINYLVESTTDNDLNVIAAFQAIGIKYGSAYQYDSRALLINASIKSVQFTSDSHTLFVFTLNYGQESNQTTDSDRDVTNPLTIPATVSFTTNRYSVVMTKAYKDDDSQGEPTQEILNTAGLPYDPPPMKVKKTSVFNITYPSLNFQGNWQKDYINTVNSSTVKIWDREIPEKHAIINDISATTQYTSEGLLYFMVSVEVEIDNDEPWNLQLLSNGFSAHSEDADDVDEIYPIYVNKTGQFVTKNTLTAAQIKNKEAEPISEPSKLDKWGYIIQPSSENSYYQTFEPYFPKSWGALNLPSKMIKTKTLASGQI
jgi:hypothetical protein